MRNVDVNYRATDQCPDQSRRRGRSLPVPVRATNTLTGHCHLVLTSQYKLPMQMNSLMVVVLF